MVKNKKIIDELQLFNKAIEDYEKENYMTSYIASNYYSTLSNDAKFWLAKHLEFGYGASKNEKKVFEYYSQVYDSKSIYREKARNRLIYCYYYSIGTDKDESKVRQLYILKLLRN
ncbi:19298_t:CDS:1 [Dentiscutata erythropus]|uniref:19298_t:CDS:1 n=1 Tax=Dentiscutata erythropus TaxID=1348616 RepID=A0A9N8YPW9_9GLOM|nr:19298_t:CDS:1 [Dentiscutata erythropus]